LFDSGEQALIRLNSRLRMLNLLSSSSDRGSPRVRLLFPERGIGGEQDTFTTLSYQFKQKHEPVFFSLSLSACLKHIRPPRSGGWKLKRRRRQTREGFPLA
jgi:hypothetical protein